ncbi:hypothetical protein BCR43DRAFT_89833 [Syncephalastrum racemosum]|uniref:Uncharacterized protein n=1 Tax=Syncephalastrum racemosum TaxID=13706 RepID=A0A1X2H3I1_SYNRA|nr:hypothetical protein BCR43DRAFT_89833 [Syncephalastrum racemosum]
MDDETDLPDLADLDLDDSDEEFWKMDEAFSDLKLLPNKSPVQSSTRPPVRVAPKPSHSPPIPATTGNRHRSGSISSENSFTSQSTITPRRIPSESARATASITQSRSMSTSTSTFASHDPISRPGSRLASTPSRLAKRASHIPAPTSSRYAPLPQPTTSARSTSTATGSTPPRPASRLTSRASHIPMTRTKHASPSSDHYSTRAQSPAPPSRLLNSYRSSSIFSTSPNEGRPGSNLRPPTASASTSSIRSQSRIGMAKRF